MASVAAEVAKKKIVTELQINYAIYIKMITSILIKPGNATKKEKKYPTNENIYAFHWLFRTPFLHCICCSAFLFEAKQTERTHHQKNGAILFDSQNDNLL